MTNIEAVLEVAGNSVTEKSAEKALTEMGIFPTGSYNVSDEAKIDLAAMKVLKSILAKPDITEGGYSEKHDRAAILKLITYLGIKNGIAEYLPAIPKVKALSVW